MKYTRDLIPMIDGLPTRTREYHYEITDETFWSFYEMSKDFSMLHVAGFYNVYRSMQYIKSNNIDGCYIECGCFLGGMAVFMGFMRRHLQLKGHIILFDTFDGPPPVEDDVTHKLPDYEAAVKNNIAEALGDTDGYRFVRGLVEDTIPPFKLSPIALLRLDTDFYSSTKVELQHCYPQLVPGGVLIVDDYGLFEGARKATDEYLARVSSPPLLNRIDGGVYAGVKPGERAAKASWWRARRVGPDGPLYAACAAAGMMSDCAPGRPASSTARFTSRSKNFAGPEPYLSRPNLCRQPPNKNPGRAS